MINNFGLLALILGSVMVGSVVLKKLTFLAALTGGLLGVAVYAGAGITGIALLGAFFILGTIATAHKKDWKKETGIAEKGESRRTAGQVFANGGVAAILGLIAFFSPQKAAVLQLMMAASLASATADTLSSELGVVYGRRFYNLRTLQKDIRGLDGVVSWEGTAAGIAGSVVIAIIYATGFGFGKIFFGIVLTGTIGNFFDSLLGATLERARLLNNNAVNFLNTLIAALAMLFLVKFL